MENLPNEVLVKIFGENRLSVEDLLALGSVSWRFYDICQDEQRLWKAGFQRWWPRIWNILHTNCSKNDESINYKTESVNVVTSRKKLRKILGKIIPNCYKHEKIPTKFLSPILDLLDFETYNPFYILNELFVIVYVERNNSPSFVVYVEQILHHVANVICQGELKTFLNSEQKNQTYERAAYYFAKYFQHQNYFEINYQQISSKLDHLAYEVQCNLKKRNGDHPAASIKLFSPDEPLRETRWTQDQSLQLFDSINFILFVKHRLRHPLLDMFSEVERLQINKTLESGLGSNYTVAIIYLSVCHRLGICLKFINDEVLIWIPPNSESEILISTYDGGILEDRFPWSYKDDDDDDDYVGNDLNATQLLVSMTRNVFNISKRNKSFPKSLIQSTLAMIMFLKPFLCDSSEIISLYETCTSEYLFIERAIKGCENFINNK